MSIAEGGIAEPNVTPPAPTLVQRAFKGVVLATATATGSYSRSTALVWVLNGTPAGYRLAQAPGGITNTALFIPGVASSIDHIGHVLQLTENDHSVQETFWTLNTDGGGAIQYDSIGQAGLTFNGYTNGTLIYVRTRGGLTVGGSPELKFVIRKAIN